MKALFLISILSVTFHCNAEVDENFTIIYASGNDVRLMQSNDVNKTRGLTSVFLQKVTALSIIGDHLYTMYTSKVRPTSFMSRCSLIRSPKTGELQISNPCPEYQWAFDGKPNAFVVALGKIYFDDKNNVTTEGGTKNIVKFNSNITGIDYNPDDQHFYASSQFGDLFYSRLQNNESFGEISYGFKETTTVKVAHGKVWLGFLNKDNKAELWNCFFNYTVENSVLDGRTCEFFHEYDNSYGKIVQIGATRDCLYVNLENSTYLSRCSRNEIRSCRDDIMKPRGMSGPFVIDLQK